MLHKVDRFNENLQISAVTKHYERVTKLIGMNIDEMDDYIYNKQCDITFDDSKIKQMKKYIRFNNAFLSTLNKHPMVNKPLEFSIKHTLICTRDLLEFGLQHAA